VKDSGAVQDDGLRRDGPMQNDGLRFDELAASAAQAAGEGADPISHSSTISFFSGISPTALVTIASAITVAIAPMSA
jgi:hypothetical protein